MTRQLLDQVAHRLPAAVPATVGGLAELTPREHEVLQLIADGVSNAEIAAALVISEATVKSHVSSVLAKLGLRSRIQAVICAYEAGVVKAGQGRRRSRRRRGRRWSSRGRRRRR
ncbi:MAG TPA: helix-turn-helix transcriptional regulator [Solirubrobacterales bacterium]